MVWRPGTAGDADGIAFALTAHGGPHLLHVTGWLPGSDPADLTCSELLLDVPGPDAALDGRIFAMALVRFGRVSERRAVISLDGDARTSPPSAAPAAPHWRRPARSDTNSPADGWSRRATPRRPARAAWRRCAGDRRPSVPPAASPTRSTACSTRPTRCCWPTRARARPGTPCPASTRSRSPSESAADCPRRSRRAPDPSRTLRTSDGLPSARTRARSRAGRSSRGCRPSRG
jgi:hypothetical protein